MAKSTLLFPLLLLAFASVIAKAEKPPVTKWVVKSPLEQKEFIENKGQYTIPDKNVGSQDILYGARVGGLEYYFTKTSIWINHEQPVKRTAEEIAQIKLQLEAKGITVDEKRIQYKYVTQYHQMNFLGANPQVEITGDNLASDYHNFGTKGSSLTARAFKKITYINLYPGIDMEIYFREDTTGFEYSFTVHPGADASQIKIQYPLNEGLSITKDGSIDIRSAYGDLIDHAPVASQLQKTNALSCSFKLDNGVVELSTGNYDNTKSLTIDPWTITPIFTGVNDGYYIDFDNAGNCYVYGGDYPWILAKYNSSGVLLWTFKDDFTSVDPYIANFGVDRQSQSVYLIEAFNQSGSEMDKLNSSGTEIAHYDGNTNVIEMWRIAFSRCNLHQAVVGGGSIAGGPYNSGFYLDTTLTTVTPVNILGSTSGYNDVCMLTLDNNSPQSNAYMAFCGETGVNSNLLLQVPTQTANPYLGAYNWKVKDGYNFVTAGTVWVGSSINAVSLPNGYSGETYSTGNDLFTYDSYVLKKWDASTGAFVIGKSVINTPSGDSSKLAWAGLTSDLCDNIFVGAANNILQYNGNLTLENTIASPSTLDTVYDLKLGNNNVLYACGQNFVEAIQLNLAYCTSFSADTTTVNVNCNRKGKASVTINGGNGPYSITWTALGSTTIISDSAVADSLEEGAYMVTITDNSCISEQIVDTVHVEGNAPVIEVNNSNPSICKGNQVVITASGADKYAWAPSSGLSSTTGSSVSANPTVTTSYTITGTKAGCSTSIIVAVTVNSSPVINVTPSSPIICTGQSITFTASGGTSYNWISENDTTDTITVSPTATTTYVLQVSTGSCTSDTGIIVTVASVVPLSIEPHSPSVCRGQGGITLKVPVTGQDYLWSPSLTLSSSTGDSVIATPTITTVYTVAGISSGGCATTGTDTVKVVSPVPLIIQPQADTVCAGQGITLNVPVSGSGYVWSPASTLNSSTGDSVIATPLVTTTYTVTGLDSLGCSVTGSVVVNVNTTFAKPITIKVSGDTLISSVTKGNQWFVNDTLIPGATNQTYIYAHNGSYSVTVTDSGCSRSSSPIIVTGGINQLLEAKNQILIYPNPTSNQLTIMSNQISIQQIEIDNILGETMLVYAPQFNNAGTTVNLDVSHLADGMYFVRITSNDETVTRKVIVSR